MVLQDHDQLKQLYLHYQSAYGYQAWEDGNLPWWVSVHSHITLSSCGLAESRDKLKLLYIHYHTDYGHQTWQTGELP